MMAASQSTRPVDFSCSYCCPCGYCGRNSMVRITLVMILRQQANDIASGLKAKWGNFKFVSSINTVSTGLGKISHLPYIFTQLLSH